MKVSNSTDKDLALFTRPIDQAQQGIAGAAIRESVLEMFEDGELQKGIVEFVWNTAVFILSSQNLLNHGMDLTVSSSQFVKITEPVFEKLLEEISQHEHPYQPSDN